ncbi:hypothetical protein [Streptomyces sp. KR80]|uniref:hypothetical protein n=1 Tax=Streptomyces sp. KR80 TaxID=3457426 RepID=UPI003FD1ED15
MVVAIATGLCAGTEPRQVAVRRLVGTSVQRGETALQLVAAGRRSPVVVPGPGQVHRDAVSVVRGVRRRQCGSQLPFAHGRVLPLAQHDVQPVEQRLPAADPPVVRRP